MDIEDASAPLLTEVVLISSGADSWKLRFGVSSV